MNKETTLSNIPFAYIKQLACKLGEIELAELFTALVLYEKYPIKKDIMELPNVEILKIYETSYREFLKGKKTLLNGQWIVSEENLYDDLVKEMSRYER